MPDKFKAVWVSHSSMSDFLSCPRRYFLRNVYKDPASGHKITVITPPLSLGQAVHDVIEELSTLPSEDRFRTPLDKMFTQKWSQVSGIKGGFKNKSIEDEFYQRGIEMMKKIEQKPGPLVNKAIKIPSEDGLPYYWLSEEDNIILCGKIDWLEFLEESNAVHIIDFKSGKNEEEESSLQLPIYLLLATNTQKRPVKKASYWYLYLKDAPEEVNLPDPASAFDKVYQLARRIKLARQIDHFKCPKGGCIHCGELEEVFRGKGKKVGISTYGQDLYIL